MMISSIKGEMTSGSLILDTRMFGEMEIGELSTFNPLVSMFDKLGEI